MSRLADVKTESNLKNPAIILFASRGLGKTTAAAQTEKPIFFALEKGLGTNKVPYLHRTNYDDVVEDLRALIRENHDYKTLVIDTIDKLEVLLFQKISKAHNKTNIAEIGYGKGYEEAVNALNLFTNALDVLRETKNMTIILLSHSKTKTIDDPMNESYSKFILALNEKTSKVFCDWADAILFGDYTLDVVEGKAVGGTKKTIIAGGRVSVEAKNRAGLPDKIDFNSVDTLKNIVAKIKGTVSNSLDKSNVDAEIKKEVVAK